ncbi:hypothetical protein [Psittacicella gerlachiana]|nr:hypothetical protein [Psittacicella gerlachiana]
MSANHLINLADELASGKITLEDLFYDQLVADVLTLKDKDLDVEKDLEHYVDTPADLQKFANFDFTKSVMLEIASLEANDSIEDVELELEDTQTDVSKTISLEPEYKNPYINYGSNYANERATAFFSENNTQQNSGYQQPETLVSSNTTTKTETSIFNKRNIFGAAFAFIATFACIGFFNKLLFTNSSFSTLAYSDHEINKALEQSNSNLTTNSLANTNLASLTFRIYQVDDPTLRNYQPQLLSNVQLVGLHLIQPSQKLDGLLLSDKQSKNLSIFIANYDIQKRLSSK